MNEYAPYMGIGMLLVLGFMTYYSGIAVWELLIGVSGIFSMIGIASGLFNMNLLGLLSSRIFGLLENDLLQAIPLYVFFGVLLQRSNLAQEIFILLCNILKKSPAAQGVSVLFLGALVAPMNGSVASSAGLISRLMSSTDLGLKAPAAIALSSVAATVGVVVPPSLVLILMGDVMMRAHTEASNINPKLLEFGSVINTQSLFHAAMLPALLLFGFWILVTVWLSRKSIPRVDLTVVSATQIFRALVTVLGILLLLAAVFTGRIYAVEAAAGACLILFFYCLFVIKNLKVWKTIFLDSLSISGALLALLLGATTFSLVFRLFESDALISNLILHSSAHSLVIAAFILVGLMLCAWILDAFEMIFVMIPIVAPGLIVHLRDAQQAGVLILLILQLSFLIPPMGYAVLLTRVQPGLQAVSTRLSIKALAPYIACLVFVIFLVFFSTPMGSFGVICALFFQEI